MKASNGLILNIFEGQLDCKTCDLTKLNLYILITHGNIELTTKTIPVTDYHPKWNQVFYLEHQCDNILLSLYHKPILLKEIHLGTCKLPLKKQNGWIHIIKDKHKIGSIKVSLSNEILPLDTIDIQDLYYKKLAEVQGIKNKVLSYRLKYKQKKTEFIKKPDNKLNELVSILKIEQENYMKALEEVNEKKRYLKEQEEMVIKDKERLGKEKERLRVDQMEIKEETFGLQNDFAELQQIRNKQSLQEKIFKASHRNSKSEGRNPRLPTSPYSRTKTGAAVVNSVPSFII